MTTINPDPAKTSRSDGMRAIEMHSLEEFVIEAWRLGLTIIETNWGEMAIEEPSGRARLYIRTKKNE